MPSPACFSAASQRESGSSLRREQRPVSAEANPEPLATEANVVVLRYDTRGEDRARISGRSSKTSVPQPNRGTIAGHSATGTPPPSHTGSCGHRNRRGSSVPVCARLRPTRHAPTAGTELKGPLLGPRVTPRDLLARIQRVRLRDSTTWCRLVVGDHWEPCGNRAASRPGSARHPSGFGGHHAHGATDCSASLNLWLIAGLIHLSVEGQTFARERHRLSIDFAVSTRCGFAIRRLSRN
jgi:hypothetical protein